jgi:hypothetical protein
MEQDTEFVQKNKGVTFACTTRLSPREAGLGTRSQLESGEEEMAVSFQFSRSTKIMTKM